MDKYILANSDIPEQFIVDFINIVKSDEDNYKFLINLDMLMQYTGKLDKNNLLAGIKKKFTEGTDYIIVPQKKSRITGGTVVNNIMLTPKCFREFCMTSTQKNMAIVKEYINKIISLLFKHYMTTHQQLAEKDGEIISNENSNL